MHFVVDDQAPIAFVEDLEMREFLVLVRPVGDDLIRSNGHGANLFAVARVLGNVGLLEIGLVEDLAPPLLDGRHAGSQNQRRFLNQCHGRDADNRLAGTAGQDDDAATPLHIATRVKDIGRFTLIVADRERQPVSSGLP